MKLYAFDVDDTLEISNGPVRLEAMQALRNSGHIAARPGLFHARARWPTACRSSDHAVDQADYLIRCGHTCEADCQWSAMIRASSAVRTRRTAAREAGFRSSGV
jgi:hypothetical protein